ncbi:hypothetical protein GEMRC1_009877 [Eukaryota sp. GEM-RC1]
MNSLLTSVDFSDSTLSENSISRIINSLEFSCKLAEINFSNVELKLEHVLNIFKLLTDHQLLPKIRISPHSINPCIGCLSYQKLIDSDDLPPLLNNLKSNVSIKHIEFRGLHRPNLSDILTILEILSINKSVIFNDLHPHQIDVKKGVFSLNPHELTEITTEMISSLKRLLQCFNIEELSFKRFRFSDEAIVVLCDLIKLNTSLTSVDFSNCRLTDDQLVLIIEALNIDSSSTLLSLNFGNNSMGNKSVLALSESLKQNSSVTKIILESNSITDEGARTFGEALLQNSTVVEVDFRGNSVSLDSKQSI